MDKIVFLVSGKLRCGKNQFADYLKESLEDLGISVRLDYYAKGVKDGCREDFRDLVDYLNSLGIEELHTEDHNWYEEKNKLTRILLQTYGTEIFRNRVSETHWIDQLKRRCIESPERVTVVTDVRFPNEITRMYGRGLDTLVVRVERDRKETDSTMEHPSETALDDYSAFDATIDNNGTLEELKAEADFMAKCVVKAYDLNE